MKLSYYPGCTLKTRAKNLEQTALAALKILSVEVEELPRWNCCGAVYSLADDDLIHIVAPVRDLIRVREAGHDTVLTLCSMCYNTLARANELMKNDEEKRKTINDFMDEEPDYAGEVKVVHLLDFLRDEIGWENLKSSVVNPLRDLKVAPYYGCTLLRPEDVAIDRPDHPQVMNEFLATLGAEAIEFPSATKCCGAYQVLGHPEATMDLSRGIIDDAIEHGAEAMALACPLCDYNLGKRQDRMVEKFEGFKPYPVFYFTQLLAIALGVPQRECLIDLNQSCTGDLLADKKLNEIST